MKQTIEGKTVIRLAYPVQTEAGEEVSEISLRRIRPADVKPLMKIRDEDEIGAVEGMTRLLATLSGLSEEVIGNLDLQDFLTASTIAGELATAILTAMPPAAARKAPRKAKGRRLN